MPTQPAILGTMRLGNFRLGYAPAALTALRRTKSRITIGGVTGGVREAGVSIHDAINDAPNTASFTKQGTAPVAGQDLRISINSDTPRLLFNGTIQTNDRVPHAWPVQLEYPCSAIDDLARLNRRRPFGTWTDVSQTTIAQYLIAVYAPGFSSAGVQADLPLISITFDGTEPFSSCLKRLASGGYYFVEDLTLYLFQTLVTDAPDAIDGTPGRLLDEPPIRMSVDDSQVRTRVYGKGHGEAVLADVAAGQTIVPIADAVMFNPLGGQAIAGTTPDGAQSQKLAYTGVQLGAGGSSVGPGIGPSVAPTPTAEVGTGLTAGTVKYAYTDITATGESLPSPIGTVEVGSLAAPPALNSVSLMASATGPDLGAHQYAYTFVTAAGETTPCPLSSGITTTGPHTLSPLGYISGFVTYGGGSMNDNKWFGYVVTLIGQNGGETTVSQVFYANLPDSYSQIAMNLANGHAGAASVKIYRSEAKDTWQECTTATKKYVGAAALNGWFYDTLADASLGAVAPTTNTASYYLRGVVVYYLAIGPTGTTGRKLYRTAAGGSQLKLVATLNNVVIIYTDLIADASLGANAPTSNTAGSGLLQVGLTGIAIGPSGTTARKVYRTVANGSQLKLQSTIANNSSTTATDNVADGSLGANAPTGDTSGFATVAGQVNAGSASILTGGAGPFSAAGGWAINGQQIIRYTGITGNTLTGIPASGPGSILTTILYGSQIMPASALTGVTGLLLPVQKGANVHIWVERNDLAAQADLIALDLAQGRVSDGVIEHTITDDRRGEASLIALCDADLALFSRNLVTVTFATRDVKTRSGKTIHIDLPALGIGPVDLTIQTVDVTEIDLCPGVPPRFSVMASNVRFSLDDLLRRALAGKAA